MKKKTTFLLLLVIVLQLYSFKENTACDVLNSNLGYAIKQATNAENAPTLNTLKYYTYKAVNTLQKLDTKIDDCGCQSAETIILKGLTLLKNVTQSASIATAKSMLSQAKKDISISIDSITAYSLNNKYGPENNTSGTIVNQAASQNKLLYAKIDSILAPFEESMNTIRNTDNCKEGYKVALSIFEKSEGKLLHAELTEAKRYYHLRTKEIAKNTLDALADCANK